MDGTRPDEVAWAIPRVPHGGVPGVAFPRPLPPTDAALLRRVFLLQAHGDILEADSALADVQDPLLIGTVLADRYLGRYHRSTAAELSEWLERYPDLPEASDIHALLVSRLPKVVVRPRAPAETSRIAPTDPDPVTEDIDPPRSGPARNPVLERAVLDRVQRGNTAAALRLIAQTRGLSRGDAALLRAEVAQVLFTRNEDVDALRVAQSALDDTEAADQPSLGFYVGGLAAWRLDRTDRARALFEGGAKATSTSAHLHSASALWASRASRVLRDPAGSVKWLRVAAEERLTFHGMLARRMLRVATGTPPSGEVLSQADVDAVGATPYGRRAFALLQFGQIARADAELRRLGSDASTSPVFARSLLMVAAAAGLTDCAVQMAAVAQSKDGGAHDELRFAVPRLHPAGGFQIDPPLVYALTRLESNFNADAVSPAGARGLMQIMPATAQYITGDTWYAPNRLHEPSSNLELGQRYLSYLARQENIDNDLIRILASYNSGPGNFHRWGADVRDRGDPLLFIEAIPVAETRAFVPRALVYSWIYAARLHLPAASLDSLAVGEFPRFTPRRQERRMALLAPELD